MFANTPQMTAGDVLNTLYRDAPYLFLGGAFVSIGLMSAAYAALRRAWDSLLIYFALFAAMYGVRLWIQSRILAITMDGSAFYTHLRSGIDYLMLIPAFLFFTSLGLPGRLERIVGYAAAGIGGVLAVVAFSFHDSNLLHLINNVVVITGLVFLLVRSMQAGSAGNENFPAADFAVIRWGLLPFFLLALWVNLAGVLSISSPRLEPFGFAAFLASLGYVAARRALRRDQQLAEIQNELEVARRIQRSILPAEFTGSANFQVVARYVPMTSVAGDFYDFVVADEYQAGLLIADVSGHGRSRCPHRFHGQTCGGFAARGCSRSRTFASGHEFGPAGKYSAPVCHRGLRPPGFAIARAALFSGRPSAHASVEARQRHGSRREWLDAGCV